MPYLDPYSVTPLLSADTIKTRIHELALQVATDYRGKEVLLVGVLKGSIHLMSDLLRELWHVGLTDCEIDFIGISSYGNDTESSKNPRITKDLDVNIEGRHVLIVEDIIDTGYSLDALLRILGERRPLSVKNLVLLSKKSRREVDVPIAYCGFEIEGWVEGYGLDAEGLYRGRPEIVLRQPHS